MRIAILGATGGTGYETVAQTLAAGHTITALVRDGAALRPDGDRLEVIVGDALDAGCVDAVVKDQDAVFMSLGLSASGSASEVVTVCTVGAQHVLAAMDRHGVRRLVAMSTHGVNDSNDGSPYVRSLWRSMGERLKDKETMETVIRASTVDWTIIRAPRISEQPPRGDYQVGERLRIEPEDSVSRVGVASFVLSELTAPAHVGQVLTIREEAQPRLRPGLAGPRAH
ncbi:NAD(P)H-binding protein [Streptomyces flaveolus]|uniref:NAD(P)H-binding protein n=1 Tax=Streptomyces flaveolus TaxID=67297 RepID=A0ABV1VM96_9ACTN